MATLVITCLHEGMNDWSSNAEEVCLCLCEQCMAFQAYMAGPPCTECGWARTCEACKAEDAYYVYMEERVARLGAELAMLPDEMECYDCGRQNLIVMQDAWGFRFVWRKPTGLGPIAEAHRDPTQMYRLACGHLTM